MNHAIALLMEEYDAIQLEIENIQEINAMYYRQIEKNTLEINEYRKKVSHISKSIAQLRENSKLTEQFFDKDLFEQYNYNE